eukprot:1674003-Rhodomonas_salina.1
MPPRSSFRGPAPTLSDCAPAASGPTTCPSAPDPSSRRAADLVLVDPLGVAGEERVVPEARVHKRVHKRRRQVRARRVHVSGTGTGLGQVRLVDLLGGLRLVHFEVTR